MGAGPCSPPTAPGSTMAEVAGRAVKPRVLWWLVCLVVVVAGCGCSWWWVSGARAALCSVGVRMPMAECGRMVPVPVDPLGGGDHWRRRCPPKGPGYGSARPCTRSLSASARAKPEGVALGTHRGDRLAVGQGLPVADGPVLHAAVVSGAPAVRSAPVRFRCQTVISRASRARSVHTGR